MAPKKQPDLYLAATGDPAIGAERMLTDQGYVVAMATATTDTADVRQSLATLLTAAQGVVVLPGWETEMLTRFEVQLAAASGIPVYSLTSDGTLTPVFTSQPTSVIEALQAAADRAAGKVIDGGVLAPDANPDEPSHMEAARIVLGPRGSFYDHPYDNFARTGYAWTAVLYDKLKPGVIIEADDVSLCMVGVKIAREAFRHKRDNIVDGHGYFMTHEMVLDEAARRAQHGPAQVD